jgi:hypothetical protein
MIDTFALALGHGLMAVAMLRLLLRPGLDEDPLLDEIAAEMNSKRQATSASGRAAARRTRSSGGSEEAE